MEIAVQPLPYSLNLIIIIFLTEVILFHSMARLQLKRKSRFQKIQHDQM